MLRSIPRAPAKVTVVTLLAKLAAAGFKTTKRTVQRELNTLSNVFPLASDDRSIPYGWNWAPDAPAFDLPAMDATTALSLRMIEQFLPSLMPPPVWATLEPQFRRAKKLLKSYGPEGLDRWTSVVRVVPREMPLLPPKVDGDAVRVIYQALLDARRVEVRYAPRSPEGGEKTYLANPLGIVARGSVSYLVCTFWNYTDIRQLALHRVQSAMVTEVAATRPDGFELDQYIDGGAFEYPIGPAIKMEILFDRDAASHLYETPLSEDQVIEDLDSKRVIVTATVKDTQQLVWWLLGFGSLIEVRAPASLRKRIQDDLAAATDLYSGRHDASL
jgi:predicted DNA-binding transcriptional regulator YafY